MEKHQAQLEEQWRDSFKDHVAEKTLGGCEAPPMFIVKEELSKAELEGFQKTLRDSLKHNTPLIVSGGGIEVIQTAPVEVIRWRKPGTNVYAITFIKYGRCLMVLGDCFAATYQWSENLTWAFLAGCGLHYFLEKCESSPHGRGFKSWDADVAKRYIGNAADPEFGWLSRDIADMMLQEGDFHSEQEWQAYLHRVWELDEIELDSDGMGDLSGAGEVPDSCAYGHWLGLKLAAIQLGLVECMKKDCTNDAQVVSGKYGHLYCGSCATEEAKDDA